MIRVLTYPVTYSYIRSPLRSHTLYHLRAQAIAPNTPRLEVSRILTILPLPSTVAPWLRRSRSASTYLPDSLRLPRFSVLAHARSPFSHFIPSLCSLPPHAGTSSVIPC